MDWKEKIESAAKILGVQLCYDEEIKEGDLYLAVRNSHEAQLLTCDENNKKYNWIRPRENAYSFDTWECVKVISV